MHSFESKAAEGLTAPQALRLHLIDQLLRAGHPTANAKELEALIVSPGAADYVTDNELWRKAIDEYRDALKEIMSAARQPSAPIIGCRQCGGPSYDLGAPCFRCARAAKPQAVSAQLSEGFLSPNQVRPSPRKRRWLEALLWTLGMLLFVVGALFLALGGMHVFIGCFPWIFKTTVLAISNQECINLGLNLFGLGFGQAVFGSWLMLGREADYLSKRLAK